MGLRAAWAAADWREHALSAHDAVGLIPNGARVYVDGACATPNALLGALEDDAVNHPGITLYHYMTRSQEGRPRRPVLNYRSLYISRDLAPIATSGRVEYTPMLLRDVARIRSHGRLRIDTVLVQVSSPDAAGMCSLGASVGLSGGMIADARQVIAEINPAMPRTRGDTLVPFDKFDAVVEVEPRMLEYRPRPDEDPGPVTEIAEYVARLVPDGATLQTGPGLLASEVLARLGNRRDLGVHSDIITDPVVDLMESGAITGRHKSMSRGRVVASYAMGTQKLYDAIDDSRDFVFRPIEEVSDPQILARQNRMVSITQAYSLDLTGQICAETLEGYPRGGVGSAPAFHYGAARSHGGRAMVCLPSRDSQGRSTVKGFLAANEPVTIPRFEAHWVITEWGTAYLYGSTTRQRAVALIELAHPDHREALLEQAKDLGLVPREQKMRSRRAYPVQEERKLLLKDGTRVWIKPTRTSDAPKLQDLFFHLDPEDVRTRFFRTLSSMSRTMAEHLTSVSYEREMAFAAVVGPREDERIVATSSYYLDPSTRLADVAYLVDPEFQGRGLGTALHRRTVEYAMSNGVRGFTADVLADNTEMLEVFRRGPGRLSTHVENGVVEVTLVFDPLDTATLGTALDADVDANLRSRWP